MRAICLNTLPPPVPPFSPFLAAPLSSTSGQTPHLASKQCENAAEGRNLKSYQWSDQQNLKYYHFLLRLKQEELLNRENGRVGKINIKMSRQVGSRTPIQCRSHNQKMLKRHGSFHAIIDYFAQYFDKKRLQRKPIELESTSGEQRLQMERMLFRQQINLSCSFMWPSEGCDCQSSFSYSQRIHFRYI